MLRIFKNSSVFAAMTIALLSAGLIVYGQEEGPGAETEETVQTPIDVDTAPIEDPTLGGTDANPTQPEPEAPQSVPPASPPSKRISIRYYVLQGGGKRAYEVRRGSKTGGRFTVWKSPKGAVGSRPIYGYTDRAAAGEQVIVHVGGGGVAREAGVKFSNVKKFSSANVNLPFNLKRTVTPVTGTSIYTFVIQDGKPTVVKRLPVGPRGR